MNEFKKSQKNTAVSTASKPLKYSSKVDLAFVTYVCLKRSRYGLPFTRAIAWVSGINALGTTVN